MKFDDMVPFIKIVAAAVVFLLVALFRNRSGHKNESLCSEFLDHHFRELKLLNHASYTGGFLSKSGLLALLSDRIVFLSEDSKTRLEFPLMEVTGIKVSRWRAFEGLAGGSLVILLGSRKLKLRLHGTAIAVWQLSLEKSAPLLAAAASAQSISRIRGL